MPGNEDPESLASSGPALSSGGVARYVPQTRDSTADRSEYIASDRLPTFGKSKSVQEENCHDDRSTDVPMDATPPLGVKLTVYRLLNMSTMFSFCFAKGILTYKGLSTVPTTLDWVSGGVLAVVWVNRGNSSMRAKGTYWGSNDVKAILGWLV